MLPSDHRAQLTYALSDLQTAQTFLTRTITELRAALAEPMMTEHAYIRAARAAYDFNDVQTIVARVIIPTREGN